MPNDIDIREQGNGGDMTLRGNDLVGANGYENMPYLLMFGGHIPAPVDGDADWWGNFFIKDESQKFKSNTERVLNTTPLNSAGRLKIEQAVIKDLKVISDNVPGTIIKVSVVIESDDRVHIGININGQVFDINWNPDIAPEPNVIPPYVPPAYVFHPRTQDFLDYLNTQVVFPDTWLVFFTMDEAKYLDRYVRDLHGEANTDYATSNIWSKFIAQYPVMGTVVVPQKVNLIDPSNALTFNSGVGHGANKFIISNAAHTVNTGFVEGADVTPNNLNIGVVYSGYTHQGGAGNSNAFIGAFQSGLRIFAIFGEYRYLVNGSTIPLPFGTADAANAYLHVQSNGTNAYVYVGAGTQIATAAYSASAVTNSSIYIGAWDGLGNGQHANADYNLAYIGKALNDTERKSLQNSVNYFMYQKGVRGSFTVIL